MEDSPLEQQLATAMDRQFFPMAAKTQPSKLCHLQQTSYSHFELHWRRHPLTCLGTDWSKNEKFSNTQRQGVHCCLLKEGFLGGENVPVPQHALSLTF